MYDRTHQHSMERQVNSSQTSDLFGIKESNSNEVDHGPIYPPDQSRSQSQLYGISSISQEDDYQAIPYDVSDPSAIHFPSRRNDMIDHVGTPSASGSGLEQGDEERTSVNFGEGTDENLVSGINGIERPGNGK